MSLFSTLKRQIPWDMTILTNHLIADVSRLSMAQIIPRIAIFLIALGLNRILPFPLVILFVTVLTILVVKWQTFGYIATTVGEWMQKKKLIRENRQLTQENGEVVQEKEQLVQYEEQLVQYGEQLVQYGEQLVQYGDH
jgi:cell shape-determining protein MreC